MGEIYYHIGRYSMLIFRVFSKPEKFSIYRKNFVQEIDKIGLSSIGIVSLMSTFIGVVIALQTASNIDSPLLPAYTVGFTVRQSIILEFSPTIIALILAGKVGSNIASEIGTMRVTEQIDALDIMGVNSAAYLILPKILAAIFIFPFLIIISMFLGIFGGMLISWITGIVTVNDYIYGIQYDFKPFSIVYAMIKTVVFAFVITTISSYFGYFSKGSALEVGRSSTAAVVYSSVFILLLNLILTQLILI
ncbi:ABC transporter permease [Cryomorpha ignava]|uniref:ABC transporter permease n=1 Tax=Cryomorpha ignava TaxID=101383 RepID=A0A7K3WNZ5_9FLAO|nr:ABC transporter permease [Cryomorpha ignava]NEN23377.1 ABC transporter permease [Cryomorpha ignava]